MEREMEFGVSSRIFGVYAFGRQNLRGSFVKTENSLINVTEKTAAGDPERAGYTFGGWKLVAENSEEDVIYKSSELAAVVDGSRLEAIWNENTQVG